MLDAWRLKAIVFQEKVKYDWRANQAVHFGVYTNSISYIDPELQLVPEASFALLSAVRVRNSSALWKVRLSKYLDQLQRRDDGEFFLGVWDGGWSCVRAFFATIEMLLKRGIFP